MSEYGVVYGMVMPVMAIPCAFIGSIALVLVPELSENFYRGNQKQVQALTQRALKTSLLVSCALIPFYLVCGEDIGVMLYSNAASGKMLSACALLLLPMSLTMISSSLLNSLGCEKHTLGIFLAGSAAMLACTFFLPRYPRAGPFSSEWLAIPHHRAFSLLLLRKKTGGLHIGTHLAKLFAALAPVTAAAYFIHRLLMEYLSYFPALAITMLFTRAGEAAMLSVLRLIDLKSLFARFFGKKRKKITCTLLKYAGKCGTIEQNLVWRRNSLK